MGGIYTSQSGQTWGHTLHIKTKEKAKVLFKLKTVFCATLKVKVLRPPAPNTLKVKLFSFDKRLWMCSFLLPKLWANVYFGSKSSLL